MNLTELIMKSKGFGLKYTKEVEIQFDMEVEESNNGVKVYKLYRTLNKKRRLEN